jgi:phytoene dehydrogenase-like protein
MGGVSDAIAGGAREMGAEIRTDASVARIIVENGKAVGVALKSGEELRAPIVVTSTHPKIAFLDHLEAKDLPDDFRQDIERWNTRSGVVKVNLALSELPVYKAHPEPAAGVHGGTIVMAPTVDYIEQAFQDARAGVPAEHPFADSCIPSFFDKTIAPEGKHILSMFTQWVPHTWADNPKPAELDAYADRVIDHYSEFAPNLKSAIIDRQVIGPHEMQEEYGLIGGNIFHGELSPEQLFHLRPAPGYADYRTPIRGLYQCGSATHGGGGVTGIPGRNVVGVIKKDKRRLKLR